MDVDTAVRLAGLASTAGAAAGGYMAYKLWRAHSLLGDKSLGLASMGLLLYIAGLALEALGSLLLSGPPGPGTGRPQEVTVILSNRWSFLALPLFIVSYAIIASAMYVGHMRVEPMAAALPLALYLYVDLNLVGLSMLAASSYITLSRYGYARLGNILFFLLAGMSHAIALSLAVNPSWVTLVASTILRGLAPIALLVASQAGWRG